MKTSHINEVNYITVHWRDCTEILNVDSEGICTESSITGRIFSGVKSEDSVGRVTVFTENHFLICLEKIMFYRSGQVEDTE